jgi:DNA-binding HxlR family transcriptional regulator
VAPALDVVGDRWALLVVRELLLSPRRYTNLLEGLRHRPSPHRELTTAASLDRYLWP